MGKLQFYGIRYIAFDCFKSDLNERMQHSNIMILYLAQKGMFTEYLGDQFFGPVLCLMCMNDLASIWDVIYSLLYADDTSMFITGPKVQELRNEPNEHLRIVSDWLKVNKVSLNVGKPNYMVFTNKPFNIEDMNITIDGSSVHIIDST